jgi:hypothetical protein
LSAALPWRRWIPFALKEPYMQETVSQLSL